MTPSGHPPAPTRSAWLAGAVFAAFLATGALANLWAFGVQDDTLVQAPPTLTRVLDGDVTAEIGKSLAKAPLPTWAATAERSASWIALGDLGPRVRRGCGDWLFLADEITPHPHGQIHADMRARQVREVAARLQARGIALQVVVIPDKTRIQSHVLCGVPRPASLEPRVRDWTQRLRASGVPALDLTPVLAQAGRDTYLRTDTHWSELGANLSAEAVTRALGAQPNGRAGFTPAQRTEQHLRSPCPYTGDLVRLAGIDALPARWLPEPDRVAASIFTQVEQAQAGSADDLFGDAQLPSVALVGTSYSGASNFVPWLAHHLRTPIANFAKDGGGFAGAITAYLNGAAYRDTPPRVLVWEIPERDLQAPPGASEQALSDWLGRTAASAR